jgi:hypothetical protein
VAAVCLGLVALPGLVFGSAYLLKDRSGIARAIIWMDADTGDHRRFPARLIEAPQRATPLERAPVDLDEELVSRRPLADLLRASATTAFIVLRGDTVVYERYFDGNDRSSIQTSFSVAKSFASALVGVAVEEEACATRRAGRPRATTPRPTTARTCATSPSRTPRSWSRRARAGTTTTTTRSYSE